MGFPRSSIQDLAPRGRRTGIRVSLKPGWLGLLALVLASWVSGPATAAGQDIDFDQDGFTVEDGDCNDKDPRIYPGAPELCNGVDDNCNDIVDEDPDPLDGISNDKDPEIDEGFGFCQYAVSGPENECKTPGRTACIDGQPRCEILVERIIEWTPEGPETGTCDDGIDNDCDGLIDAADLDSKCPRPAEICDGIDNDFDGLVDEGFSVGKACSVGVGQCQSTGLLICSPKGDTTECSAVPGSASNEGIPFGNSCSDEVDNDCDGAIDLQDESCFGFGQPELCNGEDDDRDGLIDEGFPTLGLPCSTGVGVCSSRGTISCAPGGRETVCSAETGSPGFEGDGPSCTDFLDNDCDGLTDNADPDCARELGEFEVTCSLPYRWGKWGVDCKAWHEIQFDGGSADTLEADLLAVDKSGKLLGIIENVQPGELANLQSREHPDFLEISTTTPKWGKTRHKMVAPIPLLRVRGTKNGVEDVAYCGIMPYLEVTSPDGGTVSVNDGSPVEVEAMVPLVDVNTLKITLNGIDVLAAMGIDPTLAFPTHPDQPLCSKRGECTFQMEAGCGDGSLVDVVVTDLRVEGLDSDMVKNAKAGVEEPGQVNTVSFTATGLPAGGHVFRFSAWPLRITPWLVNKCCVDDLIDTGEVSAFGIDVESPTMNQVVATAPVTVAGKVCGGNEIASFQINALPIDVSSQVCTEGDHMTSADECFLDFDVRMAEKNLNLAVQGRDSVGKFKRGSNRVIADATDVLANRTFNSDVLFGLGNVQTPVSATTMALDLGVNRALDGLVPNIQAAMTADIDPAFVVGLKEAAVQEFFNTKCVNAIADFTARATASLQTADLGDFTLEPTCSCDITTPIRLEGLNFTPTTVNPACRVDFDNGKIGVEVNLPDVRIQAGAHDRCQTNGLFGECLARTVIDVSAVTHIKNARFGFDITETQIETKTPPAPSSFTFGWNIRDNSGRPLFSTLGACVGGTRPGSECMFDAMCNGGTCVGEVKNPSFDAVVSNNSGLQCWGADVCGAFVTIGAVLIEVFTFGIADGFSILGDFDFEFNEDFLDELKASEPDPMQLDEVEVDEARVAAEGHVTITPGDINVTIRGGSSPGNGGLTVDFGAGFSVQSVDPTIPMTNGPAGTPASVPTVAEIVNVGDDVTMLIADDVFNQMFGAMKTAGLLKASCTPIDGLTVDDLLPAELDGGCESLGGDNVLGATVRGMCHAIRSADCFSLPAESRPLQTNTKIGVCVGFQNGDCTTLPFGQKQVCNLTPYRDIQSTDGILACARVDTEPELLFSDDTALDSTVDVNLLMEDLNVVFALDRNDDLDYTGTLEALPNCFAAEANGAGDCKIVASCLDLSIDARMGLETGQCSAQEQGFVFKDLMIVEPSSSVIFGAMCGAAPPNEDVQALLQSFSSRVIDNINEAAEDFTPPICVEGMNLGGILDFDSPNAKLFGLSTDGVTPGFSDYVGITVGLKEP